MNLPSWVLLCSIIVSSICTVAVTGENASSKKKMSKKEEKADIFIDEEEIDGSGAGNPEGKNDLEFSGSGYGPDDEDAELEGSDSFPNGSKNRGGMTNGNVVHRVMTEANRENVNPGTLPMPSTQAPASTLRPEPPVDEINTKSHAVEPANKNVNTDKAHGINDATKTDKSPVDDMGNSNSNGVYVVNTPDRDRTTSFFAQPGILAAVIGGAVVGLLCAILVVMFIVYRMRKKDEGSYPLEEMKRCPATNPYIKPNHREFFA